MSRLRLTKIAHPTAAPASTLEIFYDTASAVGYNTPPALVAEDESANKLVIGHFAVLEYKLLKVTNLTGSGTWTPTNGCRAIYLEAIGGGGQGGGCATSSATLSVGGGGGGGGYCASWITTAPTTVSYVCGPGGTGGSAGASGNAGSDTTWGATILVAKGGSGGAVLTAGTTFLSQVGAAGGAAASGTGDLKINGGIGGDGIRLSGTQGWSGRGGIAPVLGGGEGASLVVAITGGTAGIAATAANYGSGGGGAATLTTQQAGGVGAAGIIRVWEVA